MRVDEAQRRLRAVDPHVPVDKTYGGTELACPTVHTVRDGDSLCLIDVPDVLTVTDLRHPLGASHGPFLAWGPDVPEPQWRVQTIEVRDDRVVRHLTPPAVEDPHAPS